MVCEDTLVMFNNVRIEKKMKAGMYAHVAGYDEYIKDIDWTVKMYRQTPGLGPKVSKGFFRNDVMRRQIHSVVKETWHWLY